MSDKRCESCDESPCDCDRVTELIAKGRAEIAAGESISLDELRRKLGWRMEF